MAHRLVSYTQKKFLASSPSFLKCSMLTTSVLSRDATTRRHFLGRFVSGWVVCFAYAILIYKWTVFFLRFSVDFFSSTVRCWYFQPLLEHNALPCIAMHCHASLVVYFGRLFANLGKNWIDQRVGGWENGAHTIPRCWRKNKVHFVSFKSSLFVCRLAEQRKRIVMKIWCETQNRGGHQNSSAKGFSTKINRDSDELWM